jgi:hypothetical protein
MSARPAVRLDAWDRPIRPGLPVSAKPCLVGTLGALARDKTDRSVFALSTSHVLCPDNTAGAPVWQPRPCDQKGCDCNRVGIALRAVCDVVVSGGHRYFIDCAVARLDPDVGWDPRVAGRHIAGAGRAHRGMRVWKLGAHSGQTVGVVIDDRHEEAARVGDGCRAVPNQLLVQPIPTAGETRFSGLGDSGSILFDQDARAVGLLWGASPSGHAIACPIGPVLDALAIDLETCA